MIIKRTFFFLLILSFALPTRIQAQVIEDPFIIEKGGLFNSQTLIQKSGFKLTPLQITEFMLKDPQMTRYGNTLAGLLLTETLFNATGSVLTIWPLVQLHFLDQTPNKNLTWVGIGAVASALITKRIFIRKAVKAARFYNNGYSETPSLGIEFGSTSQGIGLFLTF